MNRIAKRTMLLVAISLFQSMFFSNVWGNVYDIARIDSIKIDGSFDDWPQEKSFCVPMLAVPLVTQLKAAGDHLASLKLAWNEQGLLAAIMVPGTKKVPGTDNLLFMSALSKRMKVS